MDHLSHHQESAIKNHTAPLHVPAGSIIIHSNHSMANSFTKNYTGVPILFSSLAPNSNSTFLGACLIIFFTAFTYRGLVCFRVYMEATHWGLKKGKKLKQDYRFLRDAGRCLCAFVTAMVGYGLMLVAMNFVLAYFFAIIVGLTAGEFIFARLTVGAGTSGIHLGC